MEKESYAEEPVDCLELLKEAEQYQNLGDLATSKSICEKILQHDPQNAIARHFLGQIAHKLKQYKEGIRHYELAIKQFPRVALFHKSISNLYIDSQQPVLAIEHLKKVILLEPLSTSHHLLLTKIYLSQAMWQSAEELVVKVLALDNQCIEAWEMYGTAQLCQGKLEEASESYRKTLSLDEKNITSLINMGKIFIKTGNLFAGKEYLLQALAIDFTNENAHNNLGNLHLLCSNPTQACESFKQAIKYNPKLLPAMVNLAITLNSCGRYEEALQQFSQVFAVRQQFELATTMSQEYFLDKAEVGLALTYLNICEWDALAAVKDQVVAKIKKSVTHKTPLLIAPFHALMLDLDMCLMKDLVARNQEEQAEKVKRIKQQLAANPVIEQSQEQKTKVRIGYISPDFGDHPVGLLIYNIFSYHDRSKYEIFAFSLQQHDDQYSTNIKDTVDYYIDLANISDEQIYREIKSRSIDILIDLAGHTQGAKSAVMALKPAPIQMTWIGCISTYGSAIDYFITTAFQTQETNKSYYFEKFLYMPECTVGCEPFDMPDEIFVSKSDYGLPNDKFIFCCFNKHYRIDRKVFMLWLEILQQAPNSVLWLPSIGFGRDNYLRAQAKLAGIDADRLIFSEPEKLTANWRHRLADVWLDTFSLSSGTAAFLCMWAGLPMVTLAGSNPHSRGGALTSRVAGAVEGVVETPQDYVTRAVEFYANRELLNSVRTRILANRKKSPLFRPQRFIKHLEHGFELVLENEKRSEKAEIIYV